MADPKFDAFIQRLKKSKVGPIPQKLKDCIASAKLNTIFDKVITDLDLAERLQSLAPGKAIRLSKNGDQARTLCLFKTLEGEYGCILETKSKDKNDEKQPIQKAKGTFKIFKPAWRLDGKNGPELYASLVVNVSKKAPKRQKHNLRSKDVCEALTFLNKEVGFAWSLPECRQLQRPIMGALYVNNKGVQQSIYAPMGTPLDKITPQVGLTREDLDHIALDIFTGLALMHEYGFTHQDLKDGNIICFKNKDAPASAQLMDYGFVGGPNYHPTAAAPYDFESPEIAIAYAKPLPNKMRHRYFSDRYQKYGLSIGKKTSLELEGQYSPEEFVAPHPANDIWSAGVTLWDLYHPNQELTSLPKEDGFFSKMLDPNRKTRATAKEMVTLLKGRVGIAAQPVAAKLVRRLPRKVTKPVPPKAPLESPKVYHPAYSGSVPMVAKTKPFSTWRIVNYAMNALQSINPFVQSGSKRFRH